MTLKRIVHGLVAALAVISFAQAQKRPLETYDLKPSDLEPDVQTKEYDNRTVEEYRVNDNLYKLKITPKNGQPYYLVDPDGTGQMQWRRNSLDLESDVRVPSWTLFKF